MGTADQVGKQPLRAILVTWSVQTLASVSQSVPIVLAPVAAIHFGAAPEQIGYFVGAVYLTAMTSGLMLSHTINHTGPVRVSQFALLACAIGLLAMLSSQLWLALLCGALIGVGYGLSNPTSALILGRHSPVRRRGLFFSVKQTSVPMGVAIAGILVPAVLGYGGWMMPIACTAVACIACAGLLETSVKRIDPELIWLGASPSSSNEGWAERFSGPLHMVYARRPVWRVGLVSLVYAAIQSSFLTFLVVYLSLTIKLGVTRSALILASAQLASVVGRPFWGWLADRTQRPAWVLAGLGVGMSIAIVLLANLTHQSGTFWVFAIAMLTAGTAVAWNGVFYAELVRHAKPAELASITGGVQFLTFAGAMIGPVLFSTVIALSGSYRVGYAFLAIIGFIAGIGLLIHGRGEDRVTG